MSGAGQSRLRTELCKTVLARLVDGDVTNVEAVVACMGVAAVVLGTFPPAARERMALELDGKLLAHANQRAKEILSGEFDRAEGGS